MAQPDTMQYAGAGVKPEHENVAQAPHAPEPAATTALHALRAAIRGFYEKNAPELAHRADNIHEGIHYDDLLKAVMETGMVPGVEQEEKEAIQVQFRSCMELRTLAN